MPKPSDTDRKSTRTSRVAEAVPTASPLTMEAIAERAGVSKITVSRALRNSDLVTPETSARIKALAEQLGYRFNHSARNLRLRRTHVIAVVLEMQPDVDRPIGDPFPLQLLGGIMQELTIRGYNMLLTTMESLDIGHGIAADGIILLGQGEDGQAQRALEGMNLPVAVWGAGATSATCAKGGVVVVGSNNVHGGACVAERFLQLQRKCVWFLGDVHHAEVAERRKGLQQRLRRAQVPVLTLNPAAFTFGAGFSTVQAQLARDEGVPDALLAASDLLAMGAVRAFSDAGLRVPEDVTVIGYDDSPAGQTFVPALSSVRQDWRQGGVLLARKVLDRLASRSTHSEILPTSLVIRET